MVSPAGRAGWKFWCDFNEMERGLHMYEDRAPFWIVLIFAGSTGWSLRQQLVDGN